MGSDSKPEVKKVLKSKQNKWSKVKISGNLVTDDGGSLEGLIGLEVLENYNLKKITKEKLSTKRKSEDINADSDSDNGMERKKRQKKKKQRGNIEINTIPGKFVRIKNNEEEKEPVKEDVNSNLSEWKSLGVTELILKALKDKGFTTPTPIQKLTIPAALIKRKDILGAAETGSGKTLAFGIPIINGILGLKGNCQLSKRQISTSNSVISVKKTKKRNERDNFTPPPEEINNFPVDSDTETVNDDDSNNSKLLRNPLYALILTPTRELAVQVKDHLVAIAKYTDIKIATVFGGLAQVKQERVLRKCPEIVVATPGRLWELITEGNEHLCKVNGISFLVIDEADRMVEKGHFEELKNLLERLNANPESKAKRQNFVFSATLSLVHELPAYLQNKKQAVVKPTSSKKLQSLVEYLGIEHPKIVDITQTRGTAEMLTECRITCQLDQKDLYLYYFLQRHPGRTIVFCNSIDCVKRITKLFNLLNCQPRALHAQMNQKQRLKNLEKFATDPAGLLLATDIAARGLDIPNVQHVIHYQVPRTSENYVHRSGRTARANKEGIAVLIMEPSEIKNYVKLCRTLGKGDDLPLFPISEKYLKSVKSRVDLAQQVDIMELKLRRTQNEIGWIKKSAKEMDIIVDDMSDFSENELYDSDDGGERYKMHRVLKKKRENLNSLLSKPLFPKGFSYKFPGSSGHLENPTLIVDHNKENAIDVMKTALKESKALKKRKNKN